MSTADLRPREHRFDVQREWITAIETYGANLTPWEEEFVAAVSSQLEAHGHLSDRQVEILERIYAEKTP